jgi:hypothetical protein
MQGASLQVRGDGYPLRYRIVQEGRNLVLNFDRFNAGTKISAPPASQVVQG